MSETMQTENNRTAQPDTTPALASQPQEAVTYTVRHNGEEHALTVDELITCAQKGMDYDRIRAQRDKYRASGVSERFGSFFENHPEITDVEQIPKDVLDRVVAGEDLHTAYLTFENRRLQEQIHAMKQAQKQLPDPVLREGAAVGDDFLSGLFGR